MLLQPFLFTRNVFGHMNPEPGESSVSASMQEARFYIHGLTITGIVWGLLIVAVTLT